MIFSTSLRRAIIGDVLIAPAGSRWADLVQLPQRSAKEVRVLPFLQLVIEGVAIEAKPVAQHVADGRAILGCRREASGSGRSSRPARRG